MTELLKRWGELEPAWCHVDDERAGVMADVGTPLERLRFAAQFHRLGQYEPLILAAVIEAITSKGWDCRLTSSQRRAGEWHAIVWRHGEPQPTFRPSLDGFGPMPAAALLTAYLAALEAEAGQ